MNRVNPESHHAAERRHAAEKRLGGYVQARLVTAKSSVRNATRDSSTFDVAKGLAKQSRNRSTNPFVIKYIVLHNFTNPLLQFVDPEPRANSAP
jgi:hypothetical protein